MEGREDAGRMFWRRLELREGPLSMNTELRHDVLTILSAGVAHMCFLGISS